MIISAVIITKNEENSIGRCLKSLEGVVDEIIVYDSGSEDSTVELSKSMGAKVFVGPWKGFSATKNLANSHASGSYILSMDADEALSEELQRSILSEKKNLKGVYAFDLINFYCGKRIRYSGWYPNTKIRLFPAGMVTWKGEYVHESLDLDPTLPVQLLKGYLYHYSINSLEEHISKVNYYSTLAAQKFFDQQKYFPFFKMISSALARFIKIFILKRGFRDGFHGAMIASMSALSVFFRYVKLKELKKRAQAADGQPE